MAQPPRVQSISREAVPDAPEWMDGLLRMLNEAHGQVGFALSQRLTFSENFQAELKDITFTVPEPVWTAASFENSWVNFGTTHNDVSYRITSNGRVLLRGLAKSGTIGATVFTLPVGYRPARQELFACNSNDLFGTFRVETTGAVVASAGSNSFFCFDGASFDAVSPALPVISSAPLAKVSHKLPSVSGVLPVYCRAAGVSAASTNGWPGVDWEPISGNMIKIKAVHGLTPGVKYTVRLLLFAK